MCSRTDRQPSVAGSPGGQPIGWFPIRSLGERHRPRIVAHLRTLSAGDRHLRFGFQASDEQIERYVSSIDFDRDEVFGVFNRKLALIALAHLAVAPVPADADGHSSAEFGISVLPASRGRGFGRRLFHHAALRARNRGVDTLVVQALSENAAMLAIARRAGASVVRDGPEAWASLQLPPDTLASHVDAAFEWSAAEFDFQWKSQARMIDEWLTEHTGVSAYSYDGGVRPRRRTAEPSESERSPTCAPEAGDAAS